MTLRLKLGLNGLYRDTDTARDLNLFQLLDPYGGTALFATSNLDTARISAHEYSVSPSVEYRLSHVLDASANYGYQRTEQIGSTNESEHRSKSLCFDYSFNYKS